VLRAWHQSGANADPPPKAEPRRPVLAGISDEALHAALHRAVEASSLRAVAEQVGMTHGGLHLYLQGTGRPRERTLRMLREWYLREADRWEGPDEQTARAAIAVLVEGLPASEQERALGEISVVVRNAYERAKISPPEWLAAVG
jgi:hypothetical protein